MRYFIYCRRSQDRDDQQVLSIESQQRELMAYAKKHQLEVVDVISEDMSAYKRGRPKFKKMMDQIEVGKADAILTWHLTRLARNGADGGLIISFMDEGRIKELRTTEKAYLNTSDDKFMMNIHFAMAKKSSDDTSSFVKNNVKTKLEKGEYPAVAPYGYLNINDNGVISGKKYDQKKQEMLNMLGRPLKRIELDPIEAPIIRKFIDLTLLGTYSPNILREKGYKMGIRGKNSGKMLCKQSVLNILSSIFYTGKFLYLNEIHQGCHEPLMTKTEFDKIQEILRGRSRPKNRKNEYLYTLLVECPQCKNRLSGEYQKGMHYYRCAKAKGKYSECSYTTHLREDKIEEVLKKVIQRIQIPDRIISWGIKYLRQQYKEENGFLLGKEELINQNIRNAKLKQERLTTKWLSEANRSGELISDEEYSAQKKSIQKEVDDMEEQLADLKGEGNNWLSKCEAFFQKVRNIVWEFETADFMGKRDILKTLGSKFILTSGKIGVELEKPFSALLEPIPAIPLSELDKEYFKTGQNDLLPSEICEWLPRLDSNQ
ncbi:recombinase family protein [Candidatus Peregrinibacteria bacterium]|nr:recombinase family protein [Candidatus Peregrinibacteria bacterium]